MVVYYLHIDIFNKDIFVNKLFGFNVLTQLTRKTALKLQSDLYII